MTLQFSVHQYPAALNCQHTMFHFFLFETTSVCQKIGRGTSSRCFTANQRRLQGLWYRHLQVTSPEPKGRLVLNCINEFGNIASNCCQLVPCSLLCIFVYYLYICFAAILSPMFILCHFWPLLSGPIQGLQYTINKQTPIAYVPALTGFVICLDMLPPFKMHFFTVPVSRLKVTISSAKSLHGANWHQEVDKPAT